MKYAGRRIFGLVGLVGIFGLSATVSAQDTFNVVATTSILADVAQNVGGEWITVSPLLPPDTDTHAYEPTADDAVRIAEADLLLSVGVGYEGFIERLIENAGGDVASVVVSEGVEILGGSEHDEHEDEAETADPATTPEAEGEEAHEDEHGVAEVIGVLGDDLECEAHEDEEEARAFVAKRPAMMQAEEEEHGVCDPHVWLDPANVIVWTNNIADAFTALDPAHADAFRANADAYIAELEALDAEIETLVAGVPEESRILVTNHDFMGYFAHAYGFEVVGTVLPGLTTGGETDPQAMSELITLVSEEGVPVIFAEVSANAQLAEVIA